MPKSDLPFGSEFSPSQIDLVKVLELAVQHAGNWKAFEDAVRTEYFEGHSSTNNYNRRKLANNTKLGMIAYQIVDRDVNLTPFGRELYENRTNKSILYEKFAKHILFNLQGLTFVQCIQDMHAAGESVTLLSLRQWLNERGISFPRGGKHPSIMRLWLEKAGIFTESWRINQTRLDQIAGISAEELEILAPLRAEQKAFLKTLANIDPGKSLPSNEIEKMAEGLYGLRFDEKNLPKQVLYPLQEAGYITLKRGTKTGGRGAKPFLVTVTDKFNRDVIVPVLRQLEEQLQGDLRPFIRKPISEILNNVSKGSKYDRGLALEALAIRLMRLIDLQYVATRLRGIATGGAEVDVIFESSRLVFSRWQVQCKNSKHVSLDDVAKEVGLTHMLKSNVIVMVTTGQIGREARKYSNTVMENSNLCIAMLDKTDIAAISTNPTKIVEFMNREAREAMKIKALSL